jgi:DNA-binding response OmpR family regulator
MNPPTVLVVEDDRPIRDMLVWSLRDQGYHVLQAPDGLEAIEVLDQHVGADTEPAVTLLDMMLPNLDGLGVLRHVSEHGHRTAVVALSASEWYLYAAKASGACATIGKPFDLDKVLDVVSCYCA